MVDGRFQGVIVCVGCLIVYLASIWYAMWLGETKPIRCVADGCNLGRYISLVLIPASLASAVEMETEMDFYTDRCRTPTDIPAWVWCKQQTRKSFSRPLDRISCWSILTGNTRRWTAYNLHVCACLAETFTFFRLTNFHVQDNRFLSSALRPELRRRM